MDCVAAYHRSSGDLPGYQRKTQSKHALVENVMGTDLISMSAKDMCDIFNMSSDLAYSVVQSLSQFQQENEQHKDESALFADVAPEEPARCVLVCVHSNPFTRAGACVRPFVTSAWLRPWPCAGQARPARAVRGLRVCGLRLVRERRRGLRLPSRLGRQAVTQNPQVHPAACQPPASLCIPPPPLPPPHSSHSLSLVALCRLFPPALLPSSLPSKRIRPPLRSVADGGGRRRQRRRRRGGGGGVGARGGGGGAGG